MEGRGVIGLLERLRLQKYLPPSPYPPRRQHICWLSTQYV